MAQELAEWRRAHPKATLTEIEGAVFGALQKLQAQALGEVVHASSTTDVAAQPTDERPRCPTCGGQLEPRGRQRRTVRPARQRAALNMDPIYTVCATCGAGLSPDEELGLLPGELSATLAEGVVRLGTRMPLEQAVTELAFFWNVDVDETTVRRYTQAAGAAYVAEQSRRTGATGARAAASRRWASRPGLERRWRNGSTGWRRMGGSQNTRDWRGGGATWRGWAARRADHQSDVVLAFGRR